MTSPSPWMPGATRLDIGDHALCDTQYPAKAIAHITWDRNATAAKPVDLVPYENLRSYFSQGGAGVAPHILWDPFTGRFTQFVPADSRSKSVVDTAGGTRTNRAGKVVIQIEALFFPYCRVGTEVYARLVDTPCKGWGDLHAWVRSWGVPDAWPMGRPTSFAPNRSEAVWEAKGGWYGHSQVPENDHQDPGSWPDFTTTEDDMTPDQAKQLADLHSVLVPYAGWGYKGKLGDKTDPTDAYAYLRNTSADVKAVLKKVGTPAAPALSDVQVAVIADRLAANPTFAQALATALGKDLAARMQS